MTENARPVTIDNDWDRFYREFPDVYDRFAVTSAPIVNVIGQMVGLDGKTVLDVASGTGQSTFELAKTAERVIGLEPWAEMRNVAIEKSMSRQDKNVAFVNGLAESVPFGKNAFDLVVSVYGFPFWFLDRRFPEGRRRAEEFIDGAELALKPGGHLVFAFSAPGQYAGELTYIISPEMAKIGNQNTQDAQEFLKSRFEYRDVEIVRQYSSVNEAVETYGFIFGKGAIDHLKENNQSAVRWIVRVWHKEVSKS